MSNIEFFRVVAIVIYAFSALACGFIFCEGLDRISQYGMVNWRKGKRSPSALLVVYIGFAIFPVINSVLALLFLLWMVAE